MLGKLLLFALICLQHKNVFAKRPVINFQSNSFKILRPEFVFQENLDNVTFSCKLRTYQGYCDLILLIIYEKKFDFL